MGVDPDHVAAGGFARFLHCELLMCTPCLPIPLLHTAFFFFLGVAEPSDFKGVGREAPQL